MIKKISNNNKLQTDNCSKINVAISETIDYLPLTRKDFDGAMNALRKSFFLHENACKGVEFNLHPEAHEDVDGLCSWIAECGISLIAKERSSGQIVGVVLNLIEVKHAAEQEDFLKKYIVDCKHPKSKALLQFGLVDGPTICNLFDLLETNCIVETVFMSVLPEYYNRGIGSRLLELSVKIVSCLKAGENVKTPFDDKPLEITPVPTVIYGFMTTIKTQRMAERLGFVVGGEINYETVFHEGKSFASRIGPETPAGVLQYLVV